MDIEELWSHQDGFDPVHVQSSRLVQSSNSGLWQKLHVHNLLLFALG